MTQDELRHDLLTVAQHGKRQVMANALFMATLVGMLVEKGVFTMEEFEHLQIKVQPELDQAFEGGLDDLACANMTLKAVVESFRAIP